ncbi:Saposin B domain-containing protein [Schistosoma japonicum]|nr:Saposin B domain-containing protein [Schistosoma japonicum]
MLKRLFILIVILGVNEVTLGLENSVSPLKQPNCRLRKTEFSYLINFHSFLKEHMNYWLSLDQNGKYKNTFIKNLCKHHAADTDKCIETLETIVKFLVQFTI